MNKRATTRRMDKAVRAAATACLLSPWFCAASDAVQVVAVPLESTTVRESVSALGVLNLVPQVLYFETSGYISTLEVEEGERVTRNQRLATLDSTRIESDRIRLELERAHAQDELRRSNELLKRRALADDELKNKAHAFELRSVELQAVRDEMRRHVLAAPTAGTVIRRYIEFPRPVTSTTPIYAIKSTDQPWLVSVHLTVLETGKVHPGDPAEVVLGDLRHPPVQGHVYRIGHHARNSDGMVEVEIALDEVPPLLRSGMTARATISTGNVKTGFALPLKAFARAGDGYGEVFVIDGSGIATELKVEFDLLNDGTVLVLTDLSGFDSAVTRGHHNLRSGAAVEAIME